MAWLSHPDAIRPITRPRRRCVHRPGPRALPLAAVVAGAILLPHGEIGGPAATLPSAPPPWPCPRRRDRRCRRRDRAIRPLRPDGPAGPRSGPWTGSAARSMDTVEFRGAGRTAHGRRQSRGPDGRLRAGRRPDRPARGRGPVLLPRTCRPRRAGSWTSRGSSAPSSAPTTTWDAGMDAWCVRWERSIDGVPVPTDGLVTWVRPDGRLKALSDLSSPLAAAPGAPDPGRGRRVQRCAAYAAATPPRPSAQPVVRGAPARVDPAGWLRRPGRGAGGRRPPPGLGGSLQLRPARLAGAPHRRARRRCRLGSPHRGHGDRLIVAERTVAPAPGRAVMARSRSRSRRPSARRAPRRVPCGCRSSSHSPAVEAAGRGRHTDAGSAGPAGRAGDAIRRPERPGRERSGAAARPRQPRVAARDVAGDGGRGAIRGDPARLGGRHGRPRRPWSARWSGPGRTAVGRGAAGLARPSRAARLRQRRRPGGGHRRRARLPRGRPGRRDAIACPPPSAAARCSTTARSPISPTSTTRCRSGGRATSRSWSRARAAMISRWRVVRWPASMTPAMSPSARSSRRSRAGRPSPQAARSASRDQRARSSSTRAATGWRSWRETARTSRSTASPADASCRQVGTSLLPGEALLGFLGP